VARGALRFRDSRQRTAFYCYRLRGDHFDLFFREVDFLSILVETPIWQ